MRGGLAGVAVLLAACASGDAADVRLGSVGIRLTRELDRMGRDLQEGYRAVCGDLLAESLRAGRDEPFYLDCVLGLEPARVDMLIARWPHPQGPDSIVHQVGERLALQRARQERGEIRAIGASYVWEPTDLQVREATLRGRVAWTEKALLRLEVARRAVEALIDETSPAPRRMNAFVDAMLWGYDWCLFHSMLERPALFVVRDSAGTDRELCAELRERSGAAAPATVP